MRYDAHEIIDAPNLGIAKPRSRGMWDSILLNKFSTPQIWLLLVITCAFIVYGFARGDSISPILFLIGFVGIVVVYGCMAHAKFGITVLFLAGYFLAIPGKMNVSFPLGTVLDLLNVLLVLGFFFRQKFRRNYDIFKNPLTFAIIIWIIYNFIELANPVAVSREAWMYTIRSTALIILTYFIYVYEIRDVKFIRFLFKLWLFLAFLGAINGLYQEFVGFLSYEKAWLYSDPVRVMLYFQGGHMRKFSFYADPVAFAYNMASAATLCVGLLFAPYQIWKKIALGLLAALFLTSMIFSGTRGAFPLLPAGVVLLVLLKFNRKVMIGSIIFGFFFVALIFVPSSNQNILRFQSAFRPNNDASYKARKLNQARIRPYIQSHPIGGGMGTTGYWGQRFSPDTYLANFPPDSGYVRVAVEMGPVGLLLICIMIFMAIKTGINNYFLIKDVELKTICLASTMVVFVYNIANYPQEAIVQFPSNIIFFLCIGLIMVSKNLDDEKNKLAAENDQ